MLISALKARRPALPGERPFHLLLLSLAVSSCGDWLYNVALLALVFGRTGSATWVALTTAARVFPVVALSPIGGVIVDRCDRRRLMIASDLMRALLMVALAVVAAAGLPILLAPVVAALATGAGMVQPSAVAASTPRLVSDGELQRGQALRATIGQAAIVAGPALGAVVLAISDPAIAILGNALTFLASAAAIRAIAPGPAFAPANRGVQAPSLMSEIRTGARALRGAPVAVKLVAADILCSGVYGVLTVTLVLISRTAGAGDGGYGVLLGAFGLGGVVGATIVGRLDAPSRWRRTLAVALALVGLSLAALGLVSTIAGAIAASLLGGGGMIVGEVLSETALPRMLDDDVLGRAYGLAFPASLSGIVAGSLLAGPLVSLFGLQRTLLLVGMFVLAMAVVLLRRPLIILPRAVAAAPAPSV